MHNPFSSIGTSSQFLGGLGDDALTFYAVGSGIMSGGEGDDGRRRVAVRMGVEGVRRAPPRGQQRRAKCLMDFVRVFLFDRFVINVVSVF